MRPPTTESCAKCGANFTCDVDGDCWCAKLPPLVPDPDIGAACLCPECLAARIKATLPLVDD